MIPAARTVPGSVAALAGTALLLALGGCGGASPSETSSIGASEPDGPSASASQSPLGENAAPSWIATGDMLAARVGFSATLLPNGKVLVAGGVPTGGELVSSALASAELYDPASGTWTATRAMSAGRSQQSATLLSNGKVLVAGGFGKLNGDPLLSAELYDPASKTWTATGNMLEDIGGAATLLGNGKVLLVGGFDRRGQRLVASAELYDPATGKWTATGAMTQARGGFTATRLLDGRVLVAGGDGSISSDVELASAELYDPVSGRWTATGTLGAGRTNYTATLLRDGRLLVAGGYNGGGVLDSAELYDPSRGTWTNTGGMINARGDNTATLLADGKVLVAGGDSPQPGHSWALAELYDPRSGTWAATASMNEARSVHTATLLADGTVLVTGGEADHALASAELYRPVSGS